MFHMMSHVNFRKILIRRLSNIGNRKRVKLSQLINRMAAQVSKHVPLQMGLKRM